MIKYIALGMCALALVAIFMYHSNIPAVISTEGQPSDSVVIGTTTVLVDIAATSAARTQGLSGRKSLAWGNGMLFIFPKAGDWGFWMKDMYFPIDIIWADKAGVTTTALPNVSSTTYPQAFHTNAPSVYVLEVRAGYAAGHDIGVGQKIVVQYNERVE